MKCKVFCHFNAFAYVITLTFLSKTNQKHISLYISDVRKNVQILAAIRLTTKTATNRTTRPEIATSLPPSWVQMSSLNTSSTSNGLFKRTVTFKWATIRPQMSSTADCRFSNSPKTFLVRIKVPMAQTLLIKVSNEKKSFFCRKYICLFVYCNAAGFEKKLLIFKNTLWKCSENWKFCVKHFRWLTRILCVRRCKFVFVSMFKVFVFKSVFICWTIFRQWLSKFKVEICIRFSQFLLLLISLEENRSFDFVVYFVFVILRNWSKFNRLFAFNFYSKNGLN